MNPFVKSSRNSADTAVWCADWWHDWNATGNDFLPRHLQNSLPRLNCQDIAGMSPVISIYWDMHPCSISSRWQPPHPEFVRSQIGWQDQPKKLMPSNVGSLSVHWHPCERSGFAFIPLPDKLPTAVVIRKTSFNGPQALPGLQNGAG